MARCSWRREMLGWTSCGSNGPIGARRSSARARQRQRFARPGCTPSLPARHGQRCGSLTAALAGQHARPPPQPPPQQPRIAHLHTVNCCRRLVCRCTSLAAPAWRLLSASRPSPSTWWSRRRGRQLARSRWWWCRPWARTPPRPSRCASLAGRQQARAAAAGCGARCSSAAAELQDWWAGAGMLRCCCCRTPAPAAAR